MPNYGIKVSGGPYNYKALDFHYANTALVLQRSQTIQPGFSGRIRVALIGLQSERSAVPADLIDAQGRFLVPDDTQPSTHLYACGVTGDVFIAAPGGLIRRVSMGVSIWTAWHVKFSYAPPYSDMDRDRFINLPHIHRHIGNPPVIELQPGRFEGMPIFAFNHPGLEITVLSVDSGIGASLYVRNTHNTPRTLNCRVYFEPNLVDMPGYGVRLRSPSNRIIFDSSCYYMDVIDIQGVKEGSGRVNTDGAYYVQCAPPLIEDAGRANRRTTKGIYYQYEAWLTRDIYLYDQTNSGLQLRKIRLASDALVLSNRVRKDTAFFVDHGWGNMMTYVMPMAQALKRLNEDSSASWPQGEHIREGEVPIMRIRDNVPGRT